MSPAAARRNFAAARPLWKRRNNLLRTRSAAQRRKDKTMAVQLGKRYKDEETGIEVLCIKPGECDLKADDREMELMQPKVLPSAD